MSTPTERPSAEHRTPQETPAERRSVDELLTELAACMSVPHFDDVLERYGDLYGRLVDAVTPERDRSTAADFCERCQPAYLRVDEGRNAELVDRERITFRLGVTVGRKEGSIRVSQRYFGAFRCFSWVI